MRFETMTRSATELTLEEFTRTTMSIMNTIPAAAYFGLKSSANGFMDRQEVMNDFSSQEGEAAEAHVLLSQNYENLTPKRSALGPQSSICGNNPQTISWENEGIGAVTVSASSLDNQSDDEETDAAQSEQSLDPSNSKRLRRMLSNRESARRSRKRKQEHLTDLELMAEEMKGENGSLYNQLTSAHQQFRDADTSNRVLKSDVEAMRAQVKLAEDMLAGGSFTCGLNQLVQSHLISPQTIVTQDQSLGRVANVSPTITIHGDDSSYSGFTSSGDISNANTNMNYGIWR